MRLSDEVIEDLAQYRSIHGIDLPNVNEPVRAANDGRLVVIDAAGGDRSLDLVGAGR